MAKFYCLIHNSIEDTKELYGEIVFTKSPTPVDTVYGICINGVAKVWGKEKITQLFEKDELKVK